MGTQRFETQTKYWHVRLSNKKTYLFFRYSSKAIFKHVESYNRDSVDFLNKYPREVDPDMEIVTFDFASLYASILHEYSLKALRFS